MIDKMGDILKNPAVWVAVSGLMSALGWENADKVFDHLVGAIGGLTALVGMTIGAYKSWKDK